jgi:heme/copper-type cytochrome/quinol oxidase subunit 2
MSTALPKKIALLCLILPYTLQLAGRNEQNIHLLSAAAPNNHEYLVNQIMSNFTVIGIIVVMLAVGVCCFYCRGFFSGGGRSQTTVIVPAAS